MLVLTFTVDDVERLMERLLSDRSVGQLNFDPYDWDTEEGPPPKATFIIQDRPLPVAGAELTSADIPRIIGELMVFGKQTDRAARVELHVSRTHDLDAKRAAFRAAVGELASAQCEERVDGHVSAIDEPLRWNWRLPPDMPAKRRQELIHELRHDAMVEQWPRIPQALFDGKTPAQIAGGNPPFDRDCPV